jgi:large subunit ribosomal protein L46
LLTQSFNLQAAQRVLNDTCGVNMNTWQVARHPVGHYVKDYDAAIEAPSGDSNKINSETPKPSQVQTVHETSTELGEKTFFIKTRIFAGQADIAQETPAWEDFAWLSKEEIEKIVHPRYWSRVKNMLSSQ